MTGLFETLRTELAEIGLHLSVWDAALDRALPCGGAGRLCETLCADAGPCAQAARDLAERIVVEGRPARGRAETGCCVVGVPVLQRRKLLGAAVACFPPTEMLDEENLARLADRFRLDRLVLQDYAEEVCRHSEDQAEEDAD